MERYRWEKKCLECDNIFYSDRQNRRFCGPDCMERYYNKKYGLKKQEGDKSEND